MGRRRRGVGGEVEGEGRIEGTETTHEVEGGTGREEET